MDSASSANLDQHGPRDIATSSVEVNDTMQVQVRNLLDPAGGSTIVYDASVIIGPQPDETRMVSHHNQRDKLTSAHAPNRRTQCRWR